MDVYIHIKIIMNPRATAKKIPPLLTLHDEEEILPIFIATLSMEYLAFNCHNCCA